MIGGLPHARIAALRSAALLAVLFFAAAAVGVELSREAGNVAAFWPPNAILLGVLLRSPRGDLRLPVGMCALANIGLNLLLGDTLAVAAAFAGANMLEVVLAYLLLARLTSLPLALTSVRVLVCVVLAAGVVAPIVGAGVGTVLVGAELGAPYGTLWRT